MSTATGPLRVVVVGVGPHGRRVVAALKGRPDSTLAGLVDRSEAALAHPDLPQAPRFSEFAAALGAGADVVCITTNGPSHAALALEALKAGVKRLLISKPLACSVAECQQILEAAKAAGARVAVDHIRRLQPTYQFLQQRIASGAWGKVRALYMQRPGIGLGCNGTHSYDAVRFLLGREVKSVVGFVDPPIGANPRGKDFVDPGGLTVMEIEGDARAIVSQVEDGAGPASLEIDLTAARIRYDERTGALEVIERDLSVKPGPGKPPSFREAELPAGVAAVVDMHDGLSRLFDELFAQGPMVCDGIHGLRSIQVLAATYASAREGHRPIEPTSTSLDSLWMPIT